MILYAVTSTRVKFLGGLRWGKESSTIEIYGCESRASMYGGTVEDAEGRMGQNMTIRCISIIEI